MQHVRPPSGTYVRRLVRTNGIPEYPLRWYPKARGELEARLPAWRDVTKAIGGLDIGLGDTEYVRGVLWYGLTDRGAEGDPAEQQRVIVVSAVLDEYLAGR